MQIHEGAKLPPPIEKRKDNTVTRPTEITGTIHNTTTGIDSDAASDAVTSPPERRSAPTWRLTLAASSGMQEDDAEPLPDADDPLGPDDPEPDDGAVPLIEAAAMDAAITASGYDGAYETMSGAEEQRIRLLLRHRCDRTLRKQPHVAVPDMIARLDALGRAQPNFAGVTTLVRHAVQLSIATGHPVRVPPLLLVGRPGTGKSRYARALADALVATLEAIDGAAIPDMGSVVGYPPVWRASGPGYVAKALVRASTSMPLLLVDEIEKIVDADRNLQPENKLLALLERNTASVWQDEFLRVPMRADGILWLFTANTVAGLSEPFLDRVVTLRIPELSPAMRDAVLTTMLSEVASASGASVGFDHPDALGPVRALGLRRARLAFELAVAKVVAAGRQTVGRADLAQAAGLLHRRDASKPRPEAESPRLQAPLGFIHPRRSQRPPRKNGPIRAFGAA